MIGRPFGAVTCQPLTSFYAVDTNKMSLHLPSELFPKENLALVLYGKNDLRVEPWPLPEKLEPDEVLLKSHSTGICGSDLHLWRNAQLAEYVMTRPFVLGHEPSAVVMRCGRDVQNLRPGDKVAIEPAIPCLRCEFCRTGRYNLCPACATRTHGLPPADGSLRRYFTFRSDFCFKLPSNISLEEGAMVEAFAVAVHACRRVKLVAGESVLICGAGPVGLMCLVCAKAFGCDRVCISDIKKSRLDMARRLGADFAYHIDTAQNPRPDDKQRAKEIVQLFQGQQPQVCLECSGVDSSQSTAIHAVRPGGRIAIVGLGSPANLVPLSTATMKELNLVGVCRIKDDYPLAIRLLESGRINLKPLITHRFPIEQAVDAFKLLGSGAEGVVKVLIQYN